MLSRLICSSYSIEVNLVSMIIDYKHLLEVSVIEVLKKFSIIQVSSSLLMPSLVRLLHFSNVILVVLRDKLSFSCVPRSMKMLSILHLVCICVFALCVHTYSYSKKDRNTRNMTAITIGEIHGGARRIVKSRTEVTCTCCRLLTNSTTENDEKAICLTDWTVSFILID